MFLRSMEADEDSEITFGKWEAARIADNEVLHWLSIPSDEAEDKGYWLVTMRDVYVNGKPLGLCDDFSDTPRCKVAMDTGSALSMGSPYQISEMLGALGIQDDCSNFNTLPELRFTFDTVGGGTYDMVLGPRDYVDRSEEGCAPTFQSIELPPSLGRMWVFGQTILRKYYSVYDAKNWRVGVAIARHTTKLRPTVAPTTPAPVVAKREVCEDEDAEMQKAPFKLPGCLAFSKMGYCNRFVPLAQHYCRLACKLCQPPAQGATTTKAGSPDVIIRGTGIVAEHSRSYVVARRGDSEI